MNHQSKIVMRPATSKKKRRWWLIILSIALVLVLVGLAILVNNLNSIARTQINWALNHYLAAGGSLDRVQIRLAAGRIRLAGLMIHAPESSGRSPLLAIDDLDVDLDLRALIDGKIGVRQVTLKGGALVIVRDKQGRFSPTRLLKPNHQTADNSAAADAEQPRPISVVDLQSIRIEDLDVELIDRRVGEQWSARLTLDLAVDDLQPLKLFKPDGHIGAIELDVSAVRVNQLPGFGRGSMLTIAKLQLASPGVNLDSPNLSIGKLHVSDLAATLVRNVKGETNLQRLAAAWKPAAADAPSPSSGSRLAAKARIPVFTFDDIQLSSMALQVVDAIDGQHWRAGWEEMDISARDVTVGDPARREIKAGAFRLDLQGTEVDPPPGSESDKLARLEELTLATQAVDLASPEIVVDQLLMQGLNASIQIDAKGVSNLQKLKAGLRGGRRSSTNDANFPKAVTRSPTAEKALPVIRLDRVRLEKAALDYRRLSVDGTAYAFPLKNIRLEAAGLRLFDDLAMAAPASLSLSYALKQPGTMPDAQYGAVAAIGPLGASVPALNAQICYTGVRFDTLGTLIPAGTRTTLNADGFDARLELALNEKAIRLQGSVISDADIRYDALRIQGPLKAPKVEMGPVFAGVFSQVSGDVGQLGKGGLDAGIHVVKSGADVAVKAGSGTWKIGGNIGSNLLEIGTGLFAMDHRKMGGGLMGTTRDTLTMTVDAVVDTGKAAGSGMTKSVSKLAKDPDALRRWDQGIADRHRAAMQLARSALAKMPYPPVTE